jgi:3-deoxy-D-manno-octulosonic-acid transferase
LRPAAALIVETEIWPNLFHVCRGRGIALCLINARLSDRSLRRYRRLRRLASVTLTDAALIAAQTERDAQRFIRLGAPAGRVAVTGNLKYDRRVAAGVRDDARRWRVRRGASRPVWVAGSAHEQECHALLSAFAALRTRHPDLLLCLAPRHPEHTGRWEREARALGLRVSLYSTAPRRIDDGCVLIVDALGVLDRFYHAADVAFVGGSLDARGGHNPIEALAAGVPVVHGPHVWNFADVYESLDVAGAARAVADADELVRVIGAWLDDPAARSAAVQAGQGVLSTRRGAVGRTLALLKERGIPD